MELLVALGFALFWVLMFGLGRIVLGLELSLISRRFWFISSWLALLIAAVLSLGLAFAIRPLILEQPPISVGPLAFVVLLISGATALGLGVVATFQALVEWLRRLR